jgi:hypothetical protein
MKLVAFAIVLSLLLATPGAGKPQEPQLQQPVVELQAYDATPLKGTFFPGGKPGWGLSLFHQSNPSADVCLASGSCPSLYFGSGPPHLHLTRLNSIRTQALVSQTLTHYCIYAARIGNCLERTK